MVTVRAGGASALMLALLAVTAPPVLTAADPTHRPQTVVATPTASSESKTAADADAGDVRPLPPGVYRAENGVSAPKLVRQVLPNYTSDAMRAEVHGVVTLEGIVGADGTISDIRVVRSLDRLHGLDDEAVRAVKLWTFEPGEKDGVPVPVLITIDSTFTMSTAVRPVKSHR